MRTMHFFTEVNKLIKTYGFTRKVAVLIVRIRLGIDNLDTLAKHDVIKVGEFYYISQFFSGKA